jgi:hypothetical protein
MELTDGATLLVPLLAAVVVSVLVDPEVYV